MREPNLIPSLPQTIDPLAPCPPGRYDDHLVSVLRAEPPCGRAEPLGGCAANASLVVRTDHFCLTERGRRIEVTHWLSPDQLDNDVAGLLADELFAPGWLSGVEIFERVFTGVVRSCVDDPLLAWCTFYGNTLGRVRQCWQAPAAATGRERTTIGELAPVYAHALQLIPAGQVLDLGSCFGFLPLLLAERPANTVTASDLSGGTMGARAAGEHPGVRCGPDSSARWLGRHGQRHPSSGAREPRSRPRRDRGGAPCRPPSGGGRRAGRGRAHRRLRPYPHL
jgi:hypothetical protein